MVSWSYHWVVHCWVRWDQSTGCLLDQVLVMALWNCFKENICLSKSKHKALAVYESSPGHCAEWSVYQPYFSISTSIRSSCTKNRETSYQPIRLQIAAISKMTECFELPLLQYGRVVNYTLRNNFTHSSCYKYIWIFNARRKCTNTTNIYFWISAVKIK